MEQRMPLKLMYITNDPKIAAIAERSGVDRIWVDLEVLGKEERQSNMDTVKSHHKMEDVSIIREILSTSELMVRVNPLFEGSKKEIDEVIDRGADIVMLPMFRSAEEAEQFVSYVSGRARVMLLCETPEAVEDLDRICQLKGIDEIHVGLNDLHLAYHMDFMFELLVDGTVDRILDKVNSYNIPCGFGGIAKLDEGKIPARHIITEHYRLGSQMAILSRSFYDAAVSSTYQEIENTFLFAIDEIREYERRLINKPDSYFEENRKTIAHEIAAVSHEIIKRKKNSCQSKDCLIKGLGQKSAYDILSALSEKYGSAFYIYDGVRFKDNYIRLLSAMRKRYSNTNIAYSYKTNYLPRLVKVVDELGGMAEVVSEMELELAYRCGVKPKNIIWNGPVKTKNGINRLLADGGIVNIDNTTEAEWVSEIASISPHVKMHVGIRIAFDVGDGCKTRFGIIKDSKDMDIVIELLQNNPNVEICLIHCHFAKRSASFWPKRVQTMIEVYDGFKEKYGILLKMIDLGGGIFGEMPSELAKQIGAEGSSYEDYAEAFSEFEKRFGDDEEKPLVIIEPGTALAADTMQYVVKVAAVKEQDDRLIANIYGSQKNIGMQGINPPIKVISKSSYREETEKPVDIVGYTCIESDCLYSGYSKKIKEDDFICFKNVGSYSFCMKPPFIMPNVPILEVAGDEVYNLKREEHFEDIFDSYRFD